MQVGAANDLYLPKTTKQLQELFQTAEAELGVEREDVYSP